MGGDLFFQKMMDGRLCSEGGTPRGPSLGSPALESDDRGSIPYHWGYRERCAVLPPPPPGRVGIEIAFFESLIFEDSPSFA